MRTECTCTTGCKCTFSSLLDSCRNTPTQRKDKKDKDMTTSAGRAQSYASALYNGVGAWDLGWIMRSMLPILSSMRSFFAGGDR